MIFRPEFLEHLQREERAIEKAYRDKFGPITRIESHENVSYRRVFRGDKAFLKSREYLFEIADENNNQNPNACFIKDLK